MSSLKPWQSSAALFLALSMGAGAAAPFVVQASAEAQTTQSTQFLDVPSDHWAKGFIDELAQRGIVTGFPDGTFHPNDRVTRAQFSAMTQKAFNRPMVQEPIDFIDVPGSYWAYSAIRAAYSIGFMRGYPSGTFYPEQHIPRAQVLVSLANGLGYSTDRMEGVLQMYSDAGEIPAYARVSVAAATEKRLVVNYPSVQRLSPNRPATRAEVAAFIYQALVSAGNAVSISSPYIVTQNIVTQNLAQNSTQPPSQNLTQNSGEGPQPQTGAVRIPAGTTLPTRYDRAEKIYVSPEEPIPVPVTLLIDRDIIAASGRLLIPVNSRVVGELRSRRGGSQFHATALITPNGTRISLDATSQEITATEQVQRDTDVETLTTGAMLGAAAAAGLAAVTGDRVASSDEILGDAGFSNLIGFFRGRDRITLILIDPNNDLDITLNAPLALQ